MTVTAAPVWVRWRTCLDEREDHHPAPARRPQLDGANVG
jgi:hypothetical protein